MPQIKISDLTFILLSAIFFATAGNIAFWKTAYPLLALDSVSQIFFLLSVFVSIFCAINIFFSLLLWAPLLKPLLFLFIGITAAANYFSVTYGVYIDRSMVQNILETTPGEAKTLLTLSFFIWLVLLALLPSVLFTWIKIKPQALLKKTIWRFANIATSLALLTIAILPLYKDYASFFRNHKETAKLITPGNYLIASYAYGMQLIEGNKPLVHIGLDAQIKKTNPQAKPKLIIFVVGETARADNFSLFGYKRQTNPMLEQQEHLLAFQNTSSCGTSTAASVPCMFSNMPREHYSGATARHQENVLDILNRAGIAVFWRENNTGCQGVCERLVHDMIHFYYSEDQCPDGFCLDDFLLESLDAHIAARRQNKDILIVLHTIGSHGPAYYRRYPQDSAIFSPTCDTNQIETCSQEELVNTYDNTIIQTDRVLAKTIDFLKKYNTDFQTAMLYASDHGESLGENGFYLHSTPYSIAPKGQTHVPMLFWGSEEFFKLNQMDYACLKNAAQNNAYSHDYIFSTLLGLMDIETTEYQASLDIFSNCKIKSEETSSLSP